MSKIEFDISALAVFSGRPPEIPNLTAGLGESQRDSGPKPMVATKELPGGHGLQMCISPKGGWGISLARRYPGHNPAGVGKKLWPATQGSPHAAHDYYAVNPDYGTKDDLKRLVTEAHRRGMKGIIDIVLRHTAWDSVLMARPDFNKHDAGGKIIPPGPALQANRR